MATIQFVPQVTCLKLVDKCKKILNTRFRDYLVDARLPLSSQNPMLTKNVGDKPNYDFK